MAEGGDRLEARPSEEPLRTPLLAERLADKLRKDIVGGKFEAGQKLPTERELSHRHDVSRAIVREALGRLKHDGLVVTRQGAGAFVASGSVNAFRLNALDNLSPADVRHVVELLSAVEATASAHAALRRTGAELKAIQKAFDRMQVAIDKGLPGIDEDIAFHRAIIVATRNPVFRDMLDFLDSRVRGFIRTARMNSRNVGLTQQVQQEHAAILQAITDRDAEAARKAAADHLNNALLRLAQYMPGWK